MDQTVTEFIRHARQKGMDHATIRVLLLSAGWKDKVVAQALASEGLDRPVPEPASTSSAREVFLYLLTVTALYTMVISLIVLFFHYLDLTFPDPAWERERWQNWEKSTQSSIRWSLAAVIVSCPLFFALTRRIGADIRRDPAKSRSAVRRLMIYLTLFVASITLMFDLITLLYYLFEGELVIRIALKALGLGVIAGVVFCYYLISLRGTRGGET